MLLHAEPKSEAVNDEVFSQVAIVDMDRFCFLEHHIDSGVTRSVHQKKQITLVRILCGVGDFLGCFIQDK